MTHTNATTERHAPPRPRYHSEGYDRARTPRPSQGYRKARAGAAGRKGAGR